MGKLMMKGLIGIQRKFPERIGAVHGKGLVYGMHVVRPGGKKSRTTISRSPWSSAALRKGCSMFSPVGYSTIKIAPPLVANRGQILDGCSVLEEAFREIAAERK